jgi:ABC-2 type transport system permease protein
MSAADMRVNKVLVRREFWENRSFWLVPLWTGGIVTALGMIAVIKVMLGFSSGGGAAADFSFDNVPDMRDMAPEAIGAYIRVMAAFVWGLFDIAMQIVVFFYMLDSVYGDRRDRSVLFWRSMPVSDTRTVLAKFATAIIVSTGITFVSVVVFQLVFLVPQLILGAYVGAHTWVLLAHPGDFIQSWLYVAYALVVQTLWFMPYYGWQLFCSSWAKRVPFLWAVLVPLLAMLAEAILFRSSHFLHVFFGHSVDWMHYAFQADPETLFRNHGDVDSLGGLVSFASVGRLLTTVNLWVGFTIAACFTYGAIWLRRKRSEI